jgi:hypothetical protein
MCPPGIFTDGRVIKSVPWELQAMDDPCAHAALAAIGRAARGAASPLYGEDASSSAQGLERGSELGSAPNFKLRCGMEEVVEVVWSLPVVATVCPATNGADAGTGTDVVDATADVAGTRTRTTDGTGEDADEHANVDDEAVFLANGVVNSSDEDEDEDEEALAGPSASPIEFNARCAFFDRNLHSRMSLDPTPARLKRARM